MSKSDSYSKKYNFRCVCLLLAEFTMSSPSSYQSSDPSTLIREWIKEQVQDPYTTLNIGDTVLTFCLTQNNLDVYQINAICEGSGDRRTRCMSYWKASCCLGLQTFGIMTLMSLQWRASGFNCQDAVICNGDFEQDSWIAFFFALIVSIICGEGLRGIGEFGMYVLGSHDIP